MAESETVEEEPDHIAPWLKASLAIHQWDAAREQAKEAMIERARMLGMISYTGLTQRDTDGPRGP